MKKLNLNQMGEIEGGEYVEGYGAVHVMSPCAKDMIGLGLTFAGAFFVTGPIGAGLFAGSFIWGAATIDC